ncbi:MAG: PEP-CTERM sorting domain-containing protein [Opitutales bacterium]
MHSIQSSLILASAGVTLSGAVAFSQLPSLGSDIEVDPAMAGVMGSADVNPVGYTLASSSGVETSFANTVADGWLAQSWSSGDVITVGDKRFSNITVFGAPIGFSSADILANLSYAGVTDLDNNFGLVFGLGGFFDSDEAAPDPSFTLVFDVEVLDPSQTAVGANMILTGSGTNTVGGVASIGETIFDGPTGHLNPSAVGLANLNVVNLGQNPTGSVFSDSESFSQPSVSFSVSKAVNVDAQADGGFAEISSFVQTFTQVPEPSTYAAIFGVLALGLAVIRRRLRRA